MAEGGREASGEARQVEDGGMSNTVAVSGFSANTTQELLELYFENSRRSGGGDMEEVEIRDRVAYITFKEAEVAQRVVSHNHHQVDGQTLTVTLFHPLPSKPCYQNRVLIQELKSAVTEELLRNFLETKAKVAEFLYGEEEGKVVVTFSNNIDIGQLRKTLQERSIEGAFLKVARVAISNCILVQNIQKSTSHDVILFYFDNKRRSGGGDVERVEMKADEGYCLVYFEDHTVIDRVVSQSHKVDGVDLEVHLHYECLGQRSSVNKSDPFLRISNPVNKDGGIEEVEKTDNQSNDEDSSSVSSNPDKESDFIELQERQKSEDEDSSSVSSNPEKESDFVEVQERQENKDLMQFAVILGWNHAIIAPQGEEALKWRFLFDCPHTQKEICKDPVMAGTSLEYRKGTLPLIFWKKFERSFKKRVEELLQKHAKQVQICNIVIPNDAVNIFLEAQELVELFQSKMVIAYKSETNLYICGKKEHMEEAIRHVNNAKDYALRSISKTETISLKDIPLQLIKRWLEVHMSTDTSNIQYKFREDQKYLHITGLERVIKQEKDKLLNLLGNITHTRCKSRLCVAHFSVFEQSGVVKYIERILQEQKLVCTWETNKADCIIIVTAFDKETCKMACKVIDAACVTEGISLQMDAVTKIFPSDSWKQELSSLCTKFDGKMTMLLDQDTNILEYVCTPDIRAMVRHEVQGLVNNWDREKHLLIEKQVADKLQKEKQKLRKLEEYCNVIISVTRKIEKMGLFIVGKDINIQLALEKLEKEFNLILKPQPKPALSWPGLENCECIYVPETSEAELIILKDECLLKSNKNNQAELKDMGMDTEIVEITPVFCLKVNQPDEVEADMVLPVDKSKRPVIFFCPNWNEGHSKDRHILDVVLCHLFEFLRSLDGDALLEIEDKKIGNWPVMEFVKQMLITFQTFLKANPVTKMSHLFLLIKDEEVYDIVNAAASDVYSANKSHAEEESTLMSKASQISCGTKALEVFVVNDQLTHRKEDVLVNTVDPELKLCFGYVSKSIYDAAGEGIRIECKSRYPNGIKPGQVAVTGAYRLSGSKLIFHGTFEKWNPKMEKKLKHKTNHLFIVKTFSQRVEKSQYDLLHTTLYVAWSGAEDRYYLSFLFQDLLIDQPRSLPHMRDLLSHHNEKRKCVFHTLKDFVTQCLLKADKAKMNSIAFPTIGTGILYYPSVLVADCMFEAVEEYIQTKPVFLHKVYFVIHKKDQKNIEAFGERKKLHDMKTEGNVIGFLHDGV